MIFRKRLVTIWLLINTQLKMKLYQFIKSK